MSNLKWRLVTIGVLCLASIWALFPRNVSTRQRRPDGTFFDTTVRRVPLRKGLDLQGGMHLALEVDDSKRAVDNKSDAIDRALKVVRSRIEGFGVSEPVIQKSGADRIIVELPGIDDRERAIKVAQDQAFLEFKITDKSQALERVLPRFDQALANRGGAALGAATVASAPSTAAANQGLQGLLTAGDTSAKADSAKAGARGDSARKDTTATLAQGGAFSKLIQQGQMPGQYFVDRANETRLQQYLADPAIQAAMPPGKEVIFGSDTMSIGGRVFRPLYVVDSRPIITGEYLTKAQPTTDPTEGTVVTFELNNEGARRFQNETGKHIGDFMAIVLDKRVMGQPPVIRSAIGRRGQITMGGKDLQAAQDLSLVLRAGALPVPLRVAEVRTIGPSLGQDSINKAKVALAVAIIFVVGIMVFYYRGSGVMAVVALGLYVLWTLAILAGFDAVLTLPGLAGFVLSIGVAVDANVLIFERIREELAHGKTVRTAIDEGFRHALPAIIDSNVSTVLTAAVLYQWGSGPVKGFAVTLIAGIVASMVTAIFVVRTFYMWWLSRSRGVQTLSI